MANQATMKAMMAAKPTSFKKSFDNSVTIVLTSAPSTLRIPISFVRWLMVKADSPNKPRHAIKIARQEKIVNNVFCLFSASYNCEKFSSRKVNWYGVSGKNFFQVASKWARAAGIFDPLSLIDMAL